MARLKSLNPKSKTYIIKAGDNEKNEQPAKVIFKRFPKLSESFVEVNSSIFENINLSNLTDAKERENFQNTIIKQLRTSMSSGTFDYKWFFDECVDCFEDLEVGDYKIKTVADYWEKMPEYAADVIAAELYEYAMKKEEFTMGELSA